jgi:uncharacterized protein
VLTVPTLVYLLGQSPTDATTGSLIIVGTAAVVGVVARRRGVDWRAAASFGLVGVPAAGLGTLANRAVPQPALLLAFSALTLAAAAAMVLDSRRGPAGSGSASPADVAAAAPPRPPTGGTAPGSSPAATQERPRRRTWSGIVLWGPVVGFLTGFLGVGGGFLVVPVLVLALRMPVPRAIATSLAVIAVNAVSSLLARTGDLGLDWAVVGPFTGAAVAGTLAGKLVADRLSGPLLARAFAALVGAVGLAVGAQAVASLLG